MVSPRLVSTSMINIIRTTPGFPTTDYTDPAVKFNDGLFEAFNIGSRFGDAGVRQPVSGPSDQSRIRSAAIHSRQDSRHASIATPPTSALARTASTAFGGGHGVCHRRTSVRPAAHHDIHVGDPLPDTFSSFITGSPFIYTVALAPTFHPAGSTSAPPRSTARTITRGYRTRGRSLRR